MFDYISVGAENILFGFLPKGVRNALGNLMGMKLFCSSVNSGSNKTPKQINRALNIAFGFSNEFTPVFLFAFIRSIVLDRWKKFFLSLQS